MNLRENMLWYVFNEFGVNDMLNKVYCKISIDESGSYYSCLWIGFIYIFNYIIIFIYVNFLIIGVVD